MINIESFPLKTSSFFASGNQLKIGIFGGTFNPPHIGHLRLAEEVAHTHGLARVVFIPCFIPPHKARGDVSSPIHRMEMTLLACRDNPVFEVSDLEIAAEGPSYTVDTLETLGRTPAVEIHFILGTDSLREIRTWKDFERLFSLSHFIVVTRPGVSFDHAWREVPESVRSGFRLDGINWVNTTGRRLVPSTVMGLDVSATKIRTFCNKGLSIRYLVTEPVRTYIIEHKLYRNSHE
jgi:nicotinate-nucleotide adenylyltransferase